MEPACVVVCPVHAIVAGDMHDPHTEIARIIAREPVRVRKPEQGTKPNVYYVGAEEAAINPEVAVEELPHMTMWSTLLKPHYEDESAIDMGKSLRPLQTINSLKPYRPVEAVRREAADAHVVYDTPKNTAPWGWKVAAYLATKALGAGVMMVFSEPQKKAAARLTRRLPAFERRADMPEMEITGRARREPGDDARAGEVAHAVTISAIRCCRNLLHRANPELPHLAFEQGGVFQHRQVNRHILSMNQVLDRQLCFRHR